MVSSIKLSLEGYATVQCANEIHFLWYNNGLLPSIRDGVLRSGMLLYLHLILV